jgi:hypothetical protein
MFKDPFKWLIHKGLIFATLLINTLSATITVIVIMISLFIDDWIRRNWP